VASEDAHWAPVDRHLEQYENGMRSALESTGWPLSRLISFVQKANYLRSQRSAERAESLAKYSHQERLVLPIEPRLDAVFGVVREVIVDNRCLVISLLPGIKGPFLAAWMNSEHGRKCRSAVMPEPGSSPRTMSPEKLLRFLDGLIVPVPELDVQASIAETVLVLRQVRQRAKQLSAGVWLAPSTVTEIKSAAQNWLVSTAPTAGR
jgi:hypothetical protein